jgi:hypothetical protein
MDVGAAALSIAVKTVRNLALVSANVPQMRLVVGECTAPANMRVPKLTVEEVGPMTGDLSEPAHGAAQQAYEAAARLYEQAAPSSTRQRHTAAWPPPISEGPRCRGERRTPGRR